MKNWFSNMKLNRKFTFLILLLVMIPTALLTMYLFVNIENSSISEYTNNLKNSIERVSDEAAKNIDSVNISSEFFANDRALMEFIRTLNNGAIISHERINELYTDSVSPLENIVDNNPYISQIKIYVDNQRIINFSEVFFSIDELEEKIKDELAANIDKELYGVWKIDESQTISRTAVIKYRNEILGYVELSTKLELMFPDIYGSDSDTIYFFVDYKGNTYGRETDQEEINEYLDVMQPYYLIDWTRDNDCAYYKTGNYPFIFTSKVVSELNGSIVCIADVTNSIGALNRNRNIYLIALALISILLIIFANNVVKRLLSQFYKIQNGISHIQEGELETRIENCGTDEMGQLGSQINEMMDRIKELMDDNVSRERLVKNSEIRSLQNQINAHFIYNVLESIKMMAEIDEKYDISDAITSLGKLLRYSMRWSSPTVTVEQELEYIRNYLALINLRTDYEIYLSLNLSPIILKQQIPKMSLQPIVENAINHGIEDIAEDTNIYVKGRLEDEDVIIEITDAGKGMTDEKIKELYKKINGEIEEDEIPDEEKKNNKGNGIGLKNVQDRIKMSFGEKYGLTINSKIDCFTKVEIRVPQTYYEFEKK